MDDIQKAIEASSQVAQSLEKQDLEPKVVTKSEDNPCWDGYEMVGTKMKDGRKVPNCIDSKDTKKSLEGLNLNKIEIESDTAMVLKSSCGDEFAVTKDGVFFLSPKSKVQILKSMRTETGAKDYIKMFGKGKVVDAVTLKSLMDYDPSLYNSNPYYVVEDVPNQPISPEVVAPVVEVVSSPILEAIEDGKAKEIVRAMVAEGYMEINSYGISCTPKWNGLLDKLVAQAMDKVLETDTQKGLTADDPDKVAEMDADVAYTESQETQTNTETTTTKSEELTPVFLFKSISEFNAWNNPDKGNYNLDTTTFNERKEHGRRYPYIARKKPTKQHVGNFGNRKVTK